MENPAFGKKLAEYCQRRVILWADSLVKPKIIRKFLCLYLNIIFRVFMKVAKKKKKFALTFFDMFLGTYVPETDRYFICIIIFIFTP